ncbi:hypothetical protein EVG20_g3668 [Dentipellis fragilis]|uniref:LysM domain-containing protein n=1 Tax=Dentipellis fragilis TaxID=205917 RepID=A0A4Y9Z2N9_9AGAM|nr:hypothetical protein EVG20_g3668 [Dentipellis fragilis]
MEAADEGLDTRSVGVCTRTLLPPRPDALLLIVVDAQHDELANDRAAQAGNSAASAKASVCASSRRATPSFVLKPLFAVEPTHAVYTPTYQPYPPVCEINIKMFARSALSALVAVAFASSALASACARNYTVQAGEYCDLISAAKNVSTYQLAVINSDAINTECTNLQPGQNICLGTQGEDCNTTYVVQPDDTCDGIMQAQALNATIFFANNPQLKPEVNPDCTNLYIGEVVCTAKSVLVPPAPANGQIPATTIPASAQPASPTVGGDDDDLPFCDEIDD